MLSVENPPPDPPCPCQFPQLNTCSDERASHKLPLTEVDLPNPPLDHHTPLPNFSIRDYVFAVRNKDIKKNWPFSLKHLQLCLKHGVKDVLPPFQPLYSVRNQSNKICTVETTPLEKLKARDFSKEPSRPENDVVLDSSDDAQLKNKIAESCINLSSCRSGEENDFPSTTTSVSQAEIESLPDNRESSLLLQTEPCRKNSIAQAAGPPGGNKTESTFRPLSRKCRLIVKFGGNSDHNSTEDIASNSTTVSETMASKVCPVCKTFSSTSNTTLNAHIDQCLSVESTPKWTADSKLTRHRIKPRKTRLMVDIYVTAPPCTLEELDRRNGTNWATISGLPTEETEITATTNEGRVSQIHPEDVGDVGPVYIDANGTKLRILSKLSDQPSVSKVREDVGARKTFKGEKGIKYILKRKKKWLAQKHHKYLKLAPQSKKIFSHKAHGTQNSICGVQEECKGEARSCEKEHVMSKQAKSSDSGTLRPWVCSKRRGFTKKISSQEDCQPVRCNWHLPWDFLIKNGQSFSGDSLAERNHVQKFSYENPIYSSGKSGRMEKSFHEVQVSNKNEQSPGRKRVGHLLVEGETSDNVESISPSMKEDSNQLRKSITSVHASCKLSSNSTGNYASLLSKKKVSTCEDTTNNPDISFIASANSSRTARVIASKAMEFSSFRKNILPVNFHSSVIESVPLKIKKRAAIRKSQTHFLKKRNEGAVPWRSEVDQQYDLMHGDAKKQVESEKIADGSHERSTVLDIRQGRGLSCIYQREEALALRSSKSATSSFGYGVQVNADSSVGMDDDLLQKVDYFDSGRSSSSLIKSIDSEFYKLSNSLKVQSNSFQFVKDCRGLLRRNEAPRGPTESGFVNDQEIFSADEVGNEMVGQDADIGMELDSEARQGSSFPDVDPIPIPGPPGSFLPSPRDMGSEDFQGNSSLTTSRIHSSPDRHDVVDGDSSDSPMSAASTISNSTAGRADFNYSEPSSSVRPYIVQETVKAIGACVEPSVQSAAAALPQATDAEVERTTSDGAYMKLDRIYSEKGSRSFKNDQPCCCQRKDKFSQGIALNFQDSQLLRRRRMASVAVPAGVKHADFNSNLRPADLDVRSDLAPPSICTNSGSEKVILPVIKPLAGSSPSKVSPSSGVVRFLGRADSDSASPSASNPILRLMGKNLMVVNKDEDMSRPLGVLQPCVQNNHQTSPFLAFLSVEPGNIQNQECHLLPHLRPQSSVIFGQDSHKAGQFFDEGLNSFRSQSDSRLPIDARLPAGMFQERHTECCFGTSMDCHEDKGDYNISSLHNRLKNKQNVSPMDNVEKVITTPNSYCQHTDSSINPVKEIKVDGAPGTENVVIRDVAKHTEGGRGAQVIASDILIPAAPNYSLSCVHSYSCYKSHERPLLGESPIVRKAGFHGTPTNLCNSGPSRWGCTSESSSVLQQSPFTAASSSTGHLRSAGLHYSPGFS